MFKRKWAETIGRIVLPALLLAVFALVLYRVNHSAGLADSTQWGSVAVHYEKARVVEVVNESLKADKTTGLENGVQVLKVKILTGAQKNTTQEIRNYLSNYTNIVGKKGRLVVVRIDTAAGGKSTYTLFTYYRAPAVYAMLLLFCLALILIGGRKGMMSVLALLFSFVCIIFLYVPLVIKGADPILSSLLISVFITAVTMLLIGGFTAKAFTAVLGSVAGLGVAALVAFAAGALCRISGFNSGDAESLVQLAMRTDIRVGGLLFGGILISALGAVVDIAMSIASSVYELRASSPQAGRGELFHFGMNVGRDMMGTMANTLILAFTGSSLTTLVMIYSNHVPYNQLVNTPWVGVEVIQGISGSIAVILTVPFMAFIASRLCRPLAAGAKAAKPAVRRFGQKCE